MKTNNLLIAFTLTLLALAFASCEPEIKGRPNEGLECTFTLHPPIATPQATYSNRVLILKSDKEGKVITIKPTENSFKQELPFGHYQLTFTADLSYQSAKLGRIDTQVELSESIEVTRHQHSFDLTPQYHETKGGFVIEELFIRPSTDPDNPKRIYKYGEQYLKITNNSDVTLYADSMAIVQSADLTNMKRDYKNSIFDHAMSVDFLYMIPGDGHTYPVKPGASLIIANDAQDHSKIFPGAIDLSKADFEIYDESSNPTIQDVDNPNVPNLIPYYKRSLTVNSFHQRGCSTIAIAKIPISREDYLKDYAWDGIWTFVHGDFIKEMHNECYQIPYDWLIDVVNLAIADMVQWLFVAPSLDAGYTGFMNSFNDNPGNESAVIRKVDHEKNGRQYLKDTNNSTEDFNRRVLPSLKKKDQ